MTLYHGRRQHDSDQLPFDIRAVWPVGVEFLPTVELVELLIKGFPDRWDEGGWFGRAITPQRIGRELGVNRGILSSKNHRDQRGYVRDDVAVLWSNSRGV